MKKIIIAIVLFQFATGCKKESTTPTTPTNTTVNNTTTVVQKLKWTKQNYMVMYKADGITENQRFEYKYDSEGKTTEYKYYYQGVLTSVQRDYVYTGDEATYWIDSYNSSTGQLLSTTKAKVGYNNN